MKVIIAGSRSIVCVPRPLDDIIKDSGFEVTEIVSGDAMGADKIGNRYAINNELPLHIFKPEWNTYGRSAGHKRNAEMAVFADAAIVLWDGHSRGAASMIHKAAQAGIPTWVEMCISKEIL